MNRLRVVVMCCFFLYPKLAQCQKTAQSTALVFDSLRNDVEARIALGLVTLEVAALSNEAGKRRQADSLRKAMIRDVDSVEKTISPRFARLRARLSNADARSALKSWWAYWLATNDMIRDLNVRDLSEQLRSRQAELRTLARKVSVEL
jgi:hypothetical protein